MLEVLFITAKGSYYLYDYGTFKRLTISESFAFQFKRLFKQEEDVIFNTEIDFNRHIRLYKQTISSGATKILTPKGYP